MAKHIHVETEQIKESTLNGIFSQTLLKNEHSSLVLMDIGPGEELSEHTSRFPVWLYTVGGKGVFSTQDEKLEMTPGNWIFIDPAEEHAVHPAEGQSVRFFLIIMKR